MTNSAQSMTPRHAAEGDPFEGTPYRALSRLASGGMGDVYLVKHRQLGRVLAAKLLHAHLAENPTLVERARIEAQSLARLRHANIVAVSGFGLANNKRPFIVMEYLKGRTLDEEIAVRGPLPVAEALGLTLQLLAALSAAHGLGIVHRDIKPSNLFLCAQEHGARLLKVLDFGVVRVLPNASPNAPDPLAQPTATGVVLGTPRYLSPEGAMGERVDVRADLYAAALMLYIMVTGRGPFDEVSRDTSMLSAHAYMAPPPPSQFARTLSQEFDAMVLKGLQKNPDERFQTATEFRRAVERHLAVLLCPPALQNTTVLQVPEETSREPIVTSDGPRFASAHPLPVRLVVAFVFCVVVAAIGIAILVVHRGAI